MTFSGAVKVNISLQLEGARNLLRAGCDRFPGIDSVSGFVVCNSKLYAIGMQAWPNQTIDVVNINAKSGAITQLDILTDTGLSAH